MTKEQLARWRELGFEFPEFYDTVAKEEVVEVKILNISFSKVEQDNAAFQKFLVKILLSSDPYNSKITAQIDDRQFTAYKKLDTIENINVVFADVFVDLSIPREDEVFSLIVDVIDNFTKKTTDTKTVNVKVDNQGGVGETEEKVNNISNKGECLCNRDFELKDFERIIYDLRKSEARRNEKISLNFFEKENCKLKEEDKNINSILNQLNATLLKYGISKCIHKIHFLAQIYHETDRLKTTLEYDTKKDYKPYFGRGAMQLTHKSNYKIYTAFYNKDSGTENDFVKDYSVIAENLYHVFNSAGWYWNQGKVLGIGKMWKPSANAPKWLKKDNPSFPKKEIKYTYKNGDEQKYGTIDFNLIAEKDLVDVISYLVNGGGNGLEERRKYVKTLKTVFDYDRCINK